jgi:hypothetical protein
MKEKRKEDEGERGRIRKRGRTRRDDKEEGGRGRKER